jgi:hypothetical protein
MTPEQHDALVRNMRLSIKARRALEGRLPEPGRALADLLRSDAPLGSEIRQMLADFLDHRAARHGRPVARFSGTGQKSRLLQFEKRIEYLRLAAEFHAHRGLPTQKFAEEKTQGSDRKLDRALACAREFDRWRAEEMLIEFGDPERVGIIDADEYEQFLREQFVDWLLDNPERDPTR